MHLGKWVESYSIVGTRIINRKKPHVPSHWKNFNEFLKDHKVYIQLKIKENVVFTKHFTNEHTLYAVV